METMSYTGGGLPPQQLPFSRKNREWRKRNVDFGDGAGSLRSRLARKSVAGMRVNYDLLNGRLHMEDLKSLLNPFGIDGPLVPDSVQHYPVLNSKLQVLRGEESRRVFDFRVVVTNPNAVTEAEERKREEASALLRGLVSDQSRGDDEASAELDRIGDWLSYGWQDMREVRANQLLNHYITELELPRLFNSGFLDALAVGEEIYQCDIVGGEPVVEKLDPMKVRVLRSGSSDRIEDADMVVIEDWWSPGRIIDTYWDQLSRKDLERIGKWPGPDAGADSMGSEDARAGFVLADAPGSVTPDGFPVTLDDLFGGDFRSPGAVYDSAGNVRVLKVYWKSRRRIKKVKGYDPETGEETFGFYPETYSARADEGEEEQSFWVNEAWEGVKIGSDIYVSMRPRPVQYNRLSNPSRCHFGIVGSVYGVNGSSPFSMVDMMKPYNYLYDVVHDRLNKLLAKNPGRMVRLDFAKVPKGWDADKWLYYMRTLGIAVEDSFREGNAGAATGKLAGAMNNASSGVVDTGLGSEIQQYTSLLEYIGGKIGDIAGISKQREGQVSNRETVGGVERATLQSSHITEWLFLTHESVKRRVLECLLETAKIAMRGRSKKFSYILSDGSEKVAEIDGDEFAECDYGLAVSNSSGVQELGQKLDTLAQAALQNQLLDFSSVMKLYTTSSLAEKQRMVESGERRAREARQRQEQEQLRQKAEADERKSEMEYRMHQEDNETKILVARINSQAEEKRFAMMQEDDGLTKDQEYRLRQDELRQKTREFDEKMKLERERQSFEEAKHRDDVSLKRRQLSGR